MSFFLNFDEFWQWHNIYVTVKREHNLFWQQIQDKRFDKQEEREYIEREININISMASILRTLGLATTEQRLALNSL